MALNRHRRFPDRLAFTLNNRIRTLLSPPEQLISKLNLRRSDVVVDFGCGPGFFTVPLAKLAGKVIAVDVSPQMLEKAAFYAAKNNVNVEFLRTDGTEIRLADESVDIILLNHVFHEVEERPRVLSEFFRITRPSGRLAIVERTRGNRLLGGRLGPPVVDQMEVIREMEGAGFNFAQTIGHGSDCIIIGEKP